MAIQSKAEKKLNIHPIDKHLSCTAELAASPIHFYSFYFFLAPACDSKTSFNDNEYSWVWLILMWAALHT